jgi:hypothetical protein
MEENAKAVVTASYALTIAYPVPERKDHVRERRNAMPDTVMLGTGISLEISS